MDGKIKTRTRKSVGEGFPLVGRDTGEGKGISPVLLPIFRDVMSKMSKLNINTTLQCFFSICNLIGAIFCQFCICCAFGLQLQVL